MSIDKIIIIKNMDGTCSILHPAPEMFNKNSRTRIELTNTGIILNTDEEVLNYIINKDVPEGLKFRIADINVLPVDREFRAAWTDENDGNMVDIDINKAIEIKKDVLRELRKPKLQELDVAYIRAEEIGDLNAKNEVTAKKQELRDITNLDYPTDIEELKVFLPDCLKEQV